MAITLASATSTPLLSRADVCLDRALQAAVGLEAHIEQLQSEISALRQEVEHLRHRDAAIQYNLRMMDEESRLAARLQQDFLPKGLPDLGSVRFHTLFRPASYVSGDLYDIFRLDETHVGFFLADAVGHGMPAALLTIFIKTALQTKEISGHGYRLLAPGEVMSRLNETLVSQNLTQATFATALYGVIDVRTLQVSVAFAGHPRPILLRHGAAIDPVEFLPGGGLLGIFGGETYPTGTLQLLPGDRLFLYTDGVEVAFGGEAGQCTDVWRQALDRHCALTSAELISTYAGVVDGQQGSLAPKDDLTLIVIEAVGERAEQIAAPCEHPACASDAGSIHAGVNDPGYKKLL